MRVFEPVSHLIQVDTLVSLLNCPRPKGFYFPGESHDFWEGVYVYEGEATATADEKVYHLGVGDFLLHPPMEFHRIWASEGHAPRLINLSFRASGAGLHTLGRCFSLPPEQQVQLWGVVSAMTTALNPTPQTEQSRHQLDVDLAATLLQSFLLALSKQDAQDPRAVSPDEERYSKILQVMKDHCQLPLSLDELAELCEMSTSNMKRIFAKYSDAGAGKYFLMLKMRRAMELLDRGMSATQVAAALNYGEPNYFYTVFKRETGMTPGQYCRRR